MNTTDTRSYYKFLSKDHVKFLMRGSIRLGGFDTYSLLEIITGDKWIGDHREAMTVTNLDSLSGNGIAIQGSYYASQSYGYCLSLSEGSLAQLSDAMINSGSPYRYDACIEIRNISALINRIRDALKDKYSNFPSMIFHAAPVAYSNSADHYNATHFGDMRRHDPFRKSELYKDQNEFRIAILMNEIDQDKNYLTVDIGDISDITVNIPISVSQTSWESPFKLSDTEARNEIFFKLNELRKHGYQDFIFRRSAISALIKAYGCLRFNNENKWRFSELDRLIMFHHAEISNPYNVPVIPGLSASGEQIINFMEIHLK